MVYVRPRLMIAGSGSGCGKTTVACAILKALRDRGGKIHAFKCGPDYIDPMYHQRILSSPSTNLDSFFFSENTLKWLLVKNSTEQGFSLIEGVMGFYDGLGINSTTASSCEIAQITQTPVVLVLNAKGAALSLLAMLSGFVNFLPKNHINGVILNQCSSMAYQILTEKITEHFEGRIVPLGYLPTMPDCALESRHLGLLTAGEVADLDGIISRLGAQAEKSIDLEGLISLAAKANPLSCEPYVPQRFSEPVRIAIAMDRAFCFYYHDNLDILREIGAELVFFSPLRNVVLPSGIQGLYLGGGYPELYTQQLAENQSMRISIKTALENGLPCIAECGGFMYLTDAIEQQPMTGFFNTSCYNTRKLTRFGYVRLKAEKDCMLCRAGEEIPAHEFHYWDCDAPGNAFTAAKASGKSWNCVHANEHIYAGFPHFHFYANPAFAENFYRACLKFEETFPFRDSRNSLGKGQAQVSLAGHIEPDPGQYVPTGTLREDTTRCQKEMSPTAQ